MNTRARILLLVLAAAVIFGNSVGTREAQAFSVGASGGVSFGSGDAQTPYKSSSIYYGAEATLGLLPAFDLGAFWDHNSLKLNTDVGLGLDFYGALARISLGLVTDVFVDAKLGVAKHESGDTAFGWGLGAGYKIEIIPMFFSISPHVGFRSLPARAAGTSFSHLFWDFGLLASLGF